MSIFDPEQQQQLRDLRRAWLTSEKAILAAHHEQLSGNTGAVKAFPAQKDDRLPVRVLRAIWRGMVALDDHRIGDVIGAIGLIVIFYLSCVAIYGFGGQ